VIKPGSAALGAAKLSLNWRRERAHQ
jgi:hypothetical protein